LLGVRRLLVDASRHHSRVAHETEDLAHDLIVSALQRGLPLTGEAFVRSARGAARRHGAFLARSAVRRRARELRVSFEHCAHQGSEDHAVEAGAPFPALSPALATTLSLLVAGLDKAELRLALGVSDTALRKRFEALRSMSPLARPKTALRPRTHELVELRRSQVAGLPHVAAQLPGIGPAKRVLAVGDPDGHGLMFAEVLTSAGGAATTGAPVIRPVAPEKGTPCSTASSRTSRSSSS
jgi:hypothetical protein